jgi:putative transcriptional regulator
LLVATPDLLDPNFERSVVLMLEHNAGGAFGLVLDRPDELDCAEVLASWASLTAAPNRVFTGGPVEPGSAFCVGVVLDGAAELPDGVALLPTGPEQSAPNSSICTVDLDADPVLVAAVVARIRVFSGYAGWSPGQLDSELREGSWFVCDARPHDVVTPDPEDLWSVVLRRQRGPLSWVANFPDDPADN